MRISAIRTILIWVLSVSLALMPGFAFSFPGMHLNNSMADWSQNGCSQSMTVASPHAPDLLMTDNMTYDTQCHPGTGSFPDNCGITCMVSVGMLNEVAIDFIVSAPLRNIIPFKRPFYSARRISSLYRPPKF